MATVTRVLRDANEVSTLISVSLLSRSRTALRTDEEDLAELEGSIERHGLLQPLIVRSSEEGYEVIAGNRRLAAVRSLGLKSVPAVVVEADDRSAFEMSLVENIQRKTLNPI
ncbi:MAG TPA: ParB/RepB/Spo0J family partition protein, partial [Nitrososphaerales archaeon]|nr:ParB/RepB/Spo0J family partition protein [Nitrososphaerales archaeon]